MFSSLTHFNIREDNLFLPRGLQRRAVEFVRNDTDVYLVAIWLVLLVAVILAKYGAAVFG